MTFIVTFDLLSKNLNVTLTFFYCKRQGYYTYLAYVV